MSSTINREIANSIEMEMQNVFLRLENQYKGANHLKRLRKMEAVLLECLRMRKKQKDISS